MISLFSSTRPVSTSEMSTFFLQAFLLLREDWFFWRGGSVEPAGAPMTGMLTAEENYPNRGGGEMMGGLRIAGGGRYFGGGAAHWSLRGAKIFQSSYRRCRCSYRHVNCHLGRAVSSCPATSTTSTWAALGIRAV